MAGYWLAGKLGRLWLTLHKSLQSPLGDLPRRVRARRPRPGAFGWQAVPGAMGNGSGVYRGDRNRNARLKRLRVLVPVTNAIAGIDLAGVRVARHT